mgnify:CR=1 FL=1|jgi:hypothetical protein|tara:strand:- start:485 stop:904 length:420 start_codon:yes stop_codon:yes gene_type:complete
MASSGFKGLLIGLVLFVIFAWLILSVAIDFGTEYGKSADEIGGGSLDVQAFYDTADSVEGNASNYRSRFESGNVDDIDDPSGVFSIITDMINLITAPFGLVAQILNNIFGVPTLVTNIVLGLLSVALIFGIWRVLRTGE